MNDNEHFKATKKIIGRGLGIGIVVLLLGGITMSILGAENFSLHLISLKEGLTGEVWDTLWLAITALTFFLVTIP